MSLPTLLNKATRLLLPALLGALAASIWFTSRPVQAQSSSFQEELDQAQTINRCEFLSGDESSFLKKVSDARARGLTVVGFTAESAKANGRPQLMALLCQ
jgi:hypothetical protein